jgi:anti-sigma-K factor RskA
MAEDVTMHEDDDQDALAAEYVLGTLSDEERMHAEALFSVDPAFETAVRQWERRLGELNVMVEAVEPPAEVWDRVKTQIGPVEPLAEGDLAAEAPHDVESLPPAGDLADLVPPSFEPEVHAGDEVPSDEIPAEVSHFADHEPGAFPPPLPPSPAPPEPAERAASGRNADVLYLSRRAARWRGVTFGLAALAALLALYIAVWQIAPNLVPPQLRPTGAQMLARSPAPARAQQDRLVAVLQPGPTGPAFLLTLDTQQRTLTVRKVSASAEAGKSYELWLISGRLGAPRSLGIVGADEFTQRPLPGNYDVDTLRMATYAVSLEPAGGSKSGAPTGPVLFTGKAVESLPDTPVQTPKT